METRDHPQDQSIASQEPSVQQEENKTPKENSDTLSEGVQEHGIPIADGNASQLGPTRVERPNAESQEFDHASPSSAKPKDEEDEVHTRKSQSETAQKSKKETSAKRSATPRSGVSSSRKKRHAGSTPPRDARKFGYSQRSRRSPSRERSYRQESRRSPHTSGRDHQGERTRYREERTKQNDRAMNDAPHHGSTPRKRTVIPSSQENLSQR